MCKQQELEKFITEANKQLVAQGKNTICVLSKNGFKKHASSTPVNVVGHRGALYAELENTRESFLQCAKWGCQAVELDVFVLPKDGSLVVFHGGGTDESPGLLDGYCLLGDSAN